MHELSLCQAIVDSVERHARGRPVSAVTVQVGHLRQVVPDTLRFSWDLVTGTTGLRGTELMVEEVRATVECARCRLTSELDMPVLVCPSCGSGEVQVLTGDELVVVSLDLVAS